MSEMRIEMDTSGALAKLDSFLQNFMEVNKVVEEVTDDALDLIIETARVLCPVDTGLLRDSIHGEGSFPNYEIVVDAQNESGQFYGFFVEWGTSKQGPQPFLWPAINAVVPKMTYRLRRQVKDFILGRG